MIVSIPPGPARSAQGSPLHTISLLVRDRPGVLVRVALVFSRRGYNIESLVVSPEVRPNELPTDDRFSRMTITCSGDPATLEQIIKQLDKLVDVVRAIDHTERRGIETEVALVKIACALDRRTEILQIAEHYNAKVVDYRRDSMILRVAGSSEKLDYFLDLLSDYNILELVRSGRILMARGEEIT
jgi:acetolactate synthase-1/3 small subunit